MRRIVGYYGNYSGESFSFFSILATGLHTDTGQDTHALIMWSRLSRWMGEWIKNQLSICSQPMDADFRCWWQQWLAMWDHPTTKWRMVIFTRMWAEVILNGSTHSLSHTQHNTHTPLHTEIAWWGIMDVDEMSRFFGKKKHNELTLTHLDNLSASLCTNTTHTHFCSTQPVDANKTGFANSYVLKCDS